MHFLWSKIENIDFSRLKSDKFKLWSFSNSETRRHSDHWSKSSSIHEHRDESKGS